MPTPAAPIATAAVLINDAALSMSGPLVGALSDLERRVHSAGWATVADHVRYVRVSYEMDCSNGVADASRRARRALAALSASLVAPVPLPAAVRLADSIDW